MFNYVHHRGFITAKSKLTYMANYRRISEVSHTDTLV
jgi:hypothetical protein